MKKLTWRPHLNPLIYDKSNKNTGKRFNDSLRDFVKRLNKAYFFNEKKFLKVTRRTVKSYGIYRLITKGNEVLKLFKRVKLDEFKKFFSINVTNRVVGWTPDYLGPSKSIMVNKGNIYFRIFRRNFSRIEKKCSETFVNEIFKSLSDDRIVYSAGYDTCLGHLKEFFKDNSSKMSVRDILDILDKSNFCWFNSAKVSFTNSDEIDNLIRINTNAYSGHYTSKLFGNDKRNSDYESRLIAKDIWKQLKTRA